MAINLQPLSNGLQLFNTGLSPGDRRGDSLPVLGKKLNENAAITLSINDKMAGTGLSWNKTTRELNLSVAPAHLLIGSNIKPYNPVEFTEDAQGFSLLNVPAHKILGDINASSIGLATGKVFVGDTGNRATATDLGDEFVVDDLTLEVRDLPWDRILNPLVTPGQMSLQENRIPVGKSDTKGKPVLLGPEFEIVDDVLGLVQGANVVGLGNIDAAGAAPNKYLGISGPVNNMYLEWKFVNEGGVDDDLLIDLHNIKSRNEPFGLAQLSVTEDGRELFWYPSIDQIRQVRNYIRYLNNLQRRVNLDNARSIAELQNANCIVLNYELPTDYTTNIELPLAPQFIPGSMYIFGGLTTSGYSKQIQSLSYGSEVISTISLKLNALSASGASDAGLQQVKASFNSTVSSPSAAYISGAGSTSGLPPLTWSTEKFVYTTQTSTLTNFGLTVNHNGAATLYNYANGYFIGGISAADLVTHLDQISVVTFSTDTSAVSSTTLSGSTIDPVYQSASVTENFSQGYIFGGHNGVNTFDAITRFVFATETLVGSSAVLGTTTNHRITAAAFDNDVYAYLVCGCSDFVPDGTNADPAQDKRIDAVSKFTFATEALVRLSGVTLATKRSSMAAEASALKGYIVGGVRRVRADIKTEQWVENIPDFAERTQVEVTQRELTGSVEVITGINATATTTVNIDYEPPRVSVQVPPPNVAVSIPQPQAHFQVPALGNFPQRYNG